MNLPLRHLRFGWWSLLATFLLSYTYFGIEEIGVQIEDPFARDDNDLPLEKICQTIERNVLSTIEGEAPAPSEERPSMPMILPGGEMPMVSETLIGGR